MPNTLFVVDDSATMRKVFELTFAGEDVTVVTHDGADGVLAKLREVRPQAAIVDVALGTGSNGYDLVRSIRSEAGVGSIPIYLLYSEHSPLDEPSARSCGAVGAIVKPFESQVLIDKVRQALAVGAKGTVSATTGNVTAPFGNPQATPAPIGGMAAPARLAETVAFTAPRTGGVLGGTTASAPLPKPAAPLGASAVKPPAPQGITTTPGGFGGAAARGVPPPPLPTASRPVAAPPLPAPTAPLPERAKPATPAVSIVEDDVQFEAPAPAKPAIAKPVEPEPAKPVAPKPEPVKPVEKPAPSVHEKVTSPLLEPAVDPIVGSVARAVEQRVAGLGLTPTQVEAVTALTRDVVERVVWEVVPQLAEAMIREELKRLTAD